jgi:hypothetical protein
MLTGTDAAAAAIRASITREQLIDFVELLRAGRKDAGEHATALGLIGAPAARIAGLSMHEVVTQRFASLVTLHGGVVINGECFPGTVLRNYQLLGRYGRLVLGKASIARPRALPKGNFTRRNGATLNRPYSLQPDMFASRLDITDQTSIYALMLTCADRKSLMRLHEIAIAVIEPDSSGFILYEDVDAFLANYGIAGMGDEFGGSARDREIQISIKSNVEPFVGGEVGGEPADTDKTVGE